MSQSAFDSTIESHKTDLKAALREGTVSVTFRKVDGNKRVMSCTLKEDLIPANPGKDPHAKANERQPNDAVQAVYDISKDGWRSFRWQNVISWEGE